MTAIATGPWPGRTPTGDGSPACEDCDDADPARSPTLIGVCDAADVDEDCDGAADDDVVIGAPYGDGVGALFADVGAVYVFYGR
ncbi:hypothetical protein LBMAG42_23240 [Deltaproteobacteria bacterium]|nr:hypothetical protein LBMAG42_23240 [Deltaproteobacteria bacterium]